MMTNWELIAKYLAGEASEDERKEFEKWLNNNPSNQAVFESFKKAMRPGSAAIPDFNDTMEEDWQKLKTEISKPGVVSKPKTRSMPLWYKIAATLLILALVGIGSWYGLETMNTSSREMASGHSVKNVSLPDGTRVWLNTNTKLTLAADFGSGDRKVTLNGEAYFEVSKDERKPFLITSGEVLTRVVGTSFNVMKASDGSVTVTVSEGKVSVAHDNKSVMLMADQVAVYNAAGNNIVKKENFDLNFLSWKTGILRFSSEPLKNVCSILSQYYRADIRLRDAALEKQKVTTVFDNIALEQALSILTMTLDLKSEKEGEVIYLSR